MRSCGRCTESNMGADIAAVFRESPEGTFQAHPVHQKWAESIGADLVGIKTSDIPTFVGRTTVADAVNCALSRPLPAYDVYLFEAPGMLYALPFLKRRIPDSTVLYLHTSWRLRGVDAYSFKPWGRPLRPLARAERAADARILRRLVRRYVDGVITVSELARSDVVRSFDGPVGVVRPFMADDTFNELSSISPSYGESTLVTVGTYREHKGTDQLVDSWGEVRAEHPNAELRLVGEGYPNRFETVPGVTCRGYVESLADALSEASGYIHPARFDASPVSTLEAMAAGLPPLVTLETGTRTEASRLSERLVLPVDQGSLIRGAVRYLSTPASEQQAMGKRAKTVAREFRESSREGRFGEVFDAILDLSTY